MYMLMLSTFSFRSACEATVYNLTLQSVSSSACTTYQLNWWPFSHDLSSAAIYFCIKNQKFKYLNFSLKVFEIQMKLQKYRMDKVLKVFSSFRRRLP